MKATRQLMASLVSALFCVAAAQAHEGMQHVLGTIASVEGQTLQVRTIDGKRLVIRLDGQTRYVRAADGAPGPQGLKRGVRIAVEALPVAGGLLAREVKIGVVAQAPASARSRPRPGHAGHAAAGQKSRTRRPLAAHGGHRPQPKPAETAPAQPPAPAHADHGAQPQPPAGAAPAHEPAPAHADHAAQPPAAAQPADPHAAHPPAAMPAAPGQHADHAMGPAAASPAESRNLFESDMSRMAGMGPRDPMQGMDRPGWTWMTMATARLLYNDQGGPSGDSTVESSNWTMVMAQRRLGSGLLTLMSMNSLEPATVGGSGSPQLFQTGEAFEGRPLVDRQHPHDFFMNLAATYRRPIREHGAAWVQFAAVGEPALGPTAFMHRASAGENPTSPLSHHWQDSSHITSTVLTAGGAWKRVVLEVSAFHGKEPDEARWDITLGALDSASARLKLSLANGWSAQVSYGFFNEAERLEPGDLRRTTASLHYGAEGDRPLAASLVWGRNREEHGVSDSLLFEGAYQLGRRDHLYARLESVEKDLDLLETKTLEEHHEEEDDSAWIRAATVGYVRDFAIFEKLRAGLGADVTVYRFPSHLHEAYGEDPLSFHVFLRVRWNQGHGSGHAAQ